MNARGWAVCNRDGTPWLYAVTFLRKEAVRMAELRSNETWEYLRTKLGFTVRRVVVRIETRKDGE